MKKSKKPEIRTARLVLRGFSEKDRDAVVSLLMNDEIAKTYMMPDFSDRRDAEKLFARLLEVSRMDDRIGYGIFAGGTLVGMINDCGFEGDSAEIGYAIDPLHRGNGYAPEALAAVINELYRMGYTRVVCGYFDGNDASRRVMEKCGMTPLDREGTVEYRGETHRCLYYYVDK